MKRCTLGNIRAIYHFPEAYEVDKDGITTHMVDRPDPYHPHFHEYYCTIHRCKFEQWHGVLDHLGELPMAQ